MKKFWVVFLLFFALTLQAEDTSDLQMCNYAKERGTINAWRDYLIKFPKGACAAIAENRLTEAGVPLPGRYDVDPRDVKSCQMARKEGTIQAWQIYLSDFPRGECATEAKMAIEKMGRKTVPSPEPAPQRTTPYVILNYLKVFPNDLGRFDSEPSTIIRQINSQEQHGYNTWRLPTNEELSLMVANSVVSSSDAYMTSDSRRSGLVRLVTDKGTAQEIAAQEAAKREQWLKSRTIENLVWSDRSSNEMNWSRANQYCENLSEGGFTDWRLPTISELKTTIQNCKSGGSSCRVSDSCLSGNNSCWSESCDCDFRKNNGGYYSKLGDDDNVWLWSSSTRSDDTDEAWRVVFNSGGVGSRLKSSSYSVRCVRLR